MYLHVPALLSADSLKEIDRLVGGAVFVAGNKTPGPLTQSTKNYLQMDRDKTPQCQELDNLLSGALWRNASLRSAALPLKATPPVVSRFEKGMSYGPHTDNPVMGRQTLIRTDLAVTVFLSDPASYKGGALSVRTEVGEINFRLPRGECLLFPAGAVRSIGEVTEGISTLATIWIQSIIQDAGQRQLIHELDRACLMVGEKAPQSDETRLLLKVYGNLMRMWGDV